MLLTTESTLQLLVTLSPVTFTVGSLVGLTLNPTALRLEYHPVEPGLREYVLPYADWSEGRAQAQAVVEHHDPEFWSQGQSSPSVTVKEKQSLHFVLHS